MLALALTLTGCVTMAGSETKAALCDQFRPIAWSSRDTAETVAGVKAHNAVGKRLCGWRP
jgi:hypothetical protein